MLRNKRLKVIWWNFVNWFSKFQNSSK